MDLKEVMFNNKCLISCIFMSSCIVHRKIDAFSFESKNKTLQNPNKPIVISADPFRYFMRLPTDKIHPSKYIQLLLILTPSIDSRSLPIFSSVKDAVKTPFHPQKTTRLLLLFRKVQSFFNPPEILPTLLLWPEQNSKSAMKRIF